MRPAADDLGTPLERAGPPCRVVSLVPSLTEALAVSAPGLLVGATDWCAEPADLAVARVRGTKNPDLLAVRALAPDLVLANEEENRAVDIAALRAAGVAVWVTAPRTLEAAFHSLDRMLRFGCGLDRPAWLDAAEAVWAQPYTGPRRRAVIPIWRRPWMALGRDTFAGDVLHRLGIDNVLADHPDRYPRFDPDRLPAYEVVVLPDEPYPFSRHDGPDAFAGHPTRGVSGRHLTWYGPSLGEARRVLRAALNVDPDEHDWVGRAASLRPDQS